MPRTRLFALVAVLVGAVVLLGGSAPARAQEASPAAPGGIACTVAPRSADELLALWFDPAGTPLATPPPAAAVASEADLPQGEPADAATVAAIDSTVQEVFACFNAGDLARAFALFTDDAVRQFGPEEGEGLEEARAFIETPATPVPAEEQSTVSTPRDARVLPDNRVGALVEDPEGIVFVIFEQQEGRWLVDELIEIAAAGTPVP